MAGLAGHAAGVLFGVDLGKSFRPGSTGRVTANAEYRSVRLAGIHGWIVGVLRLRTVTRFAVHMGVLAAAFSLSHVGVAVFTGLVSRKVNRMRGDLRNRSPAIMPVLTKGPGDNQSAKAEERQGSNREEQSQTKEMSRISEDPHQYIPPSQRCHLIQ
jgi:hypothetical protein